MNVTNACFQADMYGDSEDLLGKYFAANPDKRDKVFLATKFGLRHDVDNPGINSSPEYCRASIERSLARLKLPYVDLYYIHRLDGVTPIEKTMEVLVQLKNEGKIRHIGISECSAGSLRRAHAIHPISCVQVEYSPFVQDIESPAIDILATARELDVAIVVNSPLARGLFGGAIRSFEDVTKPGDVRVKFGLPWFQEENIEKNIALVDRITAIAAEKGVTAAQLVLGWILAQGDDFFAIPGTTKIYRLKENLGALEVKVTKEEEQAIRKVAGEVAGGRIPQQYERHNFADTPALE